MDDRRKIRELQLEGIFNEFSPKLGWEEKQEYRMLSRAAGRELENMRGRLASEMFSEAKQFDRSLDGKFDSKSIMPPINPALANLIDRGLPF